jgi:hypothetical protein
MEAVFPPGIFRIFSDDFRTDPSGNHWNLSESTEMNPESSGPEYCFQLPSIFRCIPAVSRRTSFTCVTKEISEAIRESIKIVAGATQLLKSADKYVKDAQVNQTSRKRPFLIVFDPLGSGCISSYRK